MPKINVIYELEPNYLNEETPDYKIKLTNDKGKNVKVSDKVFRKIRRSLRQEKEKTSQLSAVPAKEGLLLFSSITSSCVPGPPFSNYFFYKGRKILYHHSKFSFWNQQ
ncbi:MAG: hypothetical protein NTX92_07515 [Euryarchaeota archaeon]|nr:hypothetical protein [Euryarchaeota archaeon]